MLTGHSAKSSLLAPQRAEIQKEETQLIFYSEAFLHRNRQAVKCVRWLKPSVLKSRCCYKFRQGTQISQSFISQLCSFLGRVAKNWTFLWDQEPGRWYRFLFWMTMLSSHWQALWDADSQMREARRCWGIHKCFLFLFLSWTDWNCSN